MQGGGSSEIILPLSIQLFQELTLGDPDASGKRWLPRIFVVGCGSFDPTLNIRGRALLWTNVCVYNISLGNCIYQRKTYPFLLLFCFFLTIVKHLCVLFIAKVAVAEMHAFGKITKESMHKENVTEYSKKRSKIYNFVQS